MSGRWKDRTARGTPMLSNLTRGIEEMKDDACQESE
jgi:hypothetical protein